MSTAREDLLQLMADWGIKSGHGARERIAPILAKHAHELAEQQRSGPYRHPLWELGDEYFCKGIHAAADLIDPEVDGD